MVIVICSSVSLDEYCFCSLGQEDKQTIKIQKCKEQLLSKRNEDAKLIDLSKLNQQFKGKAGFGRHLKLLDWQNALDAIKTDDVSCAEWEYSNSFVHFSRILESLPSYHLLNGQK